MISLVRKARHLLVGAALLGLGAAGASAQGLGLFPHLRGPACPAPCNACPSPCVPEGTTVLPKDPKEMTKDPPVVAPTDPVLAPVTTAALGDSVVSIRNDAGYIDNALPVTHFRLRYDNAKFANRPDRAEFFYAKCGILGGDAKGPPLLENHVDYQDVRAYLEVAKYGVVSAFVDMPFRMLNPDQNLNTAGLADMNAGVKAALWRTDCSIVTFQFRVYIPTGDSDRGLGTNHVSLEPSILFAHSVSDRLLVFGQVGDWIPVGGSDFQGNVLNYGLGASYLAIDRCNWRLAPVAEVLGWSVLSGQQTDENLNVTSASGDQIINGKLGVRVGFGARDNMNGLLGNSDLYVGYGRALTGEVWYKDILRVEYRMQF